MLINIYCQTHFLRVSRYFCQIIGISIGFDPARFFVIVFILFWKKMHKLFKKGPIKGDFENNLKENSDNLEASFLDLQIKIEKTKFILGLFDKRFNFLFSTVKISYKSSNLPFDMFCSATWTETLHIAKASNNDNALFSSEKPLMFRMIKQGAYCNKLSNVLINFLRDIKYTSKIKLKMFKTFRLYYLNSFVKKIFIQAT